MPWCPVCKNEYVEGYTHCKDCDVDLVASLEDGPSPIIFGEQATINSMAEFLVANGIQDAFVRFDEKEKTYELFVSKESRPKAAELLNVYIRENVNQEEERDGQEEEMQQTEDASSLEAAEAYVDKAQQAEEYKSSAMALLLVGGVGLVVLVLLLLDFLPFHMYGMSKVVTGVVMAAVFAGFLVMGASSMKLQKKYLILAEKEKEQMDKMLICLKEKYTADQVDALWKQPDANEEIDEAQVYYKRIEIIKSGLAEEFPQEERAFIEKIADDWYSGQFDKEAEEENN